LKYGYNKNNYANNNKANGQSYGAGVKASDKDYSKDKSN